MHVDFAAGITREEKKKYGYYYYMLTKVKAAHGHCAESLIYRT